jgi:transcriptional regulator GlxA family with amidase domain
MHHSDFPDRPKTVLFLLVPGFPLMAYASAIEPLRAANVLAGRTLYAWRHLAVGATEAAASNGVAIRADFDAAIEPGPGVVLVCAGGNPAALAHPPTWTRLRAFARQGAVIGGISAGAYILAQAGLLDDYRCTIHWEHAEAFAEAFPNLNLTRSLYEIDRDRMTCAGGIAALDMMHAMISSDHGQPLAAAVSDWYLQTQIRTSTDDQRLSVRQRYGTANPKLTRVLQQMEAQVENPVGRRDLAALAGISVRQLERLFALHLGGTIDAQYRQIRLDRARVLLAQTAVPVLEIALMCGFGSASHFSRSYKAAFGTPPRAERRSRQA